mgnify:CR=1 FL=1
MKYTLITGASSGLGRETAIYLSESRNLILNARNIERLEETKSLCKSTSDIILWPYDLSLINDLELNFVEFIKNIRLERSIEIEFEAFVHCAGVMKMLPLRSLSLNSLNEVYAVNVFVPCMIVKILASKKFNGKNLNSVVFISSNISDRGAAAFCAYGSSKSALDGLMRNLAVELAPSVRVNSILPGGMRTAMTADIFGDINIASEFNKNYPLGIGTPADIVPAVEFLLSEKARWITGQQIVIDGGRTINITERKA